MGNIKVLPEHVIAKIAAGEVVERPASVVKELIDNAIDAGATSIEINVVAGGKKQISVIDNGTGMDSSDVKLCVERHATSKISSESELTTIRTMGFRGEALAAISSISRLHIETKVAREDVLEGTLLIVEGGVIREHRATGCPSGTRVVVDDLFFNVPARKKFLKSDNVEFGHIAEIVSSLALANHLIRFELKNNMTSRIRCLLTGDLKARIGDVLYPDVSDSLYEFAEKGDGISLKGFLVKSGLTRSTSKDLHFFLNGRPIKDRILQHAVLSGYETFLERGAYPIVVLYLDIDPEMVDVNVHPTKREVRFANSKMVHDFVAASVKKTLSPGVRVAQAVERFYEKHQTPANTWTRQNQTSLGSTLLLPPRFSDSQPIDSLKEKELYIESRLRVLGQLGRAYVICEDDEGRLVLIDQHAAHERLGFEALKKQYLTGSVEQQRLLLPEQLKLTTKEFSVVTEHKREIENSGFEIEPFGGDTLVVKAIPALLGDVSLSCLFETLASELLEFGSSDATEEVIDKIFSIISCHRQVRIGDSLTNEEMDALVRDLERHSISHCPHGRPAIITIERHEIDKWFKRV